MLFQSQAISTIVLVTFIPYTLLFIYFWIHDCTGYDPRPIGPWAEHSQKPKLGPNLLVSPSRFRCVIEKPTSIKYDLTGDVFVQNNTCPRQLSTALGNIAAEQSFGGRNQFQCHHLCFDRAYPLLGIIKLDPTHTSKTRTQSWNLHQPQAIIGGSESRERGWQFEGENRE